MLILMNVIASLLILALIGLIATLAMIVRIARGFVNSAKTGVQMVERPKNGAIELVNAIRGRALVIGNRFKRIAEHVTSSAAAVSVSASVVGTVARDTAEQLEKARAATENASSSAANAEQSFRFFQQLISVLQDARK